MLFINITLSLNHFAYNVFIFFVIFISFIKKTILMSATHYFSFIH